MSRLVPIWSKLLTEGNDDFDTAEQCFKTPCTEEQEWLSRNRLLAKRWRYPP
jgi:hypothetical protein